MRERRLAERYETDGTATLIADPSAVGSCVAGHLIDLSADGALVELRGAPPAEGMLFPGRLSLGGRVSAPCPVRVVRVFGGASANGGPSGVGVRFEDPTGGVLTDIAETLCSVASRPGSLVDLAEPGNGEGERVVHVGSSALARIALRGSGRVFRALGPDGRSPFARFLVRAEGRDGTPRLTAHPVGDGAGPANARDEVRTLAAEGHRSLILLRAVLRAGPWPAELVPQEAVFVRRRGADRLLLGAGCDVRVRIVHPLIAGRLVDRPAWDVGERGLSLRGDVRADALAPGMFLQDLVVTLPGGEEIALAGSVRSVRPDARSAGHVWGIRIETPEVPEAWGRFVLGRLLPDVHQMTADEVDEVWALFDRSGYLREKTSDMVARKQRPFCRAWSRIARTPTVGAGVVLRDRSVLRGTVFQTQAYPGTFLLHQLALDLHAPDAVVPKPAVAGQVYRYLYHLCARTPGLRHALGFFNVKREWWRHLCDDFVALAGDGADQSLEVLRLAEKQIGPAGPEPTCGDVVVRPFREDDRGAIESAARATIPRVAREALALEPLDPALDEMDRVFRRAGLWRRRRVLVAERSGETLGTAIVDSAAAGVNIFGMLDVVTLLPVSAAEGWSWAAAVLRSAEELRRAEAAESVVVLHPAEWPADCLPEPFATVAVLKRWVLGRSLLPEYLAYLDEHFGATAGAQGAGVR